MTPGLAVLRNPARAWLLAAWALVLSACACEPVAPGSAMAHGLWLREHPQASPSQSNFYTCSTCHALTAASANARILPGAPLAGAIARPSFWGGQVRDLLPAINVCRFWFMDAKQPWLPEQAEARAVWAWLEVAAPALPEAVTWSAVGSISDVPAGQAAAGAQVYQAACANCHGKLHSGSGRISKQAPILPEEFLAEHQEYSPQDRRLIGIEKVRHGPFLGYGGRMPPFARQVLSDAQLADLLAYLGL
ncbi:MAG: cytochrome c [Deltaproteobacteria bacterium]|nr:cytochrome c [Deltaproteobacteria bacterium]